MVATPSSSSERIAKADLSSDSHQNHSSVGVDEKAVLRKIDLHIIPWLALLYLLSFLDRGSIGNAKASQYGSPVILVHLLTQRVSQLYNLEKDIGINDRQYLIALTVFFFPYALFEVPDSPILKK